ncbi:MAG: hypothetical protein M3O50_13390 [Myxococcota bacterium]|nr:hypothetical protein [Myxococcota bacterium]
MHDAFVPLLVAITAFLIVLLWRVRPVIPWGRRRSASREAFRTALRRVEAARTDADRARALCDTADVMAKQMRRAGNATGLYMRAVRADPTSVDVVERAALGLAGRPRALESLLWRHLAITPWGIRRESTRVALEALQRLYEGPLRSAVRARALAHARDTLLRAERDGASNGSTDQAGEGRAIP